MAAHKLLLLTYHFPPSAAAGTFRMLGFAEHLPRFGWQCAVVAPPCLPWEPADHALTERIPAETSVYHATYPSHWLWKPLRKVVPWGAWLPFAAARCYQAIREQRPDVILTSGPPHVVHLLGRHLHRRAGLPWVADFRDPWVGGDRSTVNRFAAANWEIRAEPTVMREASAILANTQGSRDLLQRVYPEYAGKMTSITNGYDPDRFEPNPIPPLSGPTIEIVHTGTIYANRSPGAFLKAIGQLEPAVLAGRALRVTFIGGFMGDQGRDEIDRMVREGLSATVLVEGDVPYLQAIRAMVQADLLLLLDSPGRRVGVPAKLYEYIGAGRPILALAESESDVAWVLRESRVPHRIAPPRDPEAIGRTLADLLRDPATVACGGRHRSGQPRFTREHAAGELAAVLDSIPGSVSLRAGERRLTESAR